MEDKQLFELVSSYQPQGDQPKAIEELVNGLKEGKKCQVLLGATGTGKTFTVSNVIQAMNRPTLVFAHNKTLAGQLYAELKEFFPKNRVEYFVSNFDYYQPEAYLPSSDTYIDKTATTNQELDMLRMAAVNSVLERRDTIIVASVACIYGASNPEQRICEVEPLTGKLLNAYSVYVMYPASGYATRKDILLRACDTIGEELKERSAELEREGKLLEKQRLEQRASYDIEALREFGVCPGIENYSRHIDGRRPGERPYTLLDYFPKDFLLIVDESHVSLPQIRGMYNGDRARKETLVNYGFRLPSALDNRPMRFEEFTSMINQAIYVSATPGDYELEQTHGEIVEQIIRPTGLLDPQVEVRPTAGQIDDLVDEIRTRIERNERVLVTALTVRMAEELTNYLKQLDLKVGWLHHEVKTIERSEIIRDLRLGKIDVLIGINLLREGLDIPEVSLIAILDADKEGFLRSERSLIQIIGRAARNADGRVIMYADKMTDSMSKAINETNRRRGIQIEYNKAHNIIPKTIIKPVHEVMHSKETQEMATAYMKKKNKLGKKDKVKLLESLEKEMKEAAKALDFERAAELRDMIIELRGE